MGGSAHAATRRIRESSQRNLALPPMCPCHGPTYDQRYTRTANQIARRVCAARMSEIRLASCGYDLRCPGY
jgi:hypothetical protein